MEVILMGPKKSGKSSIQKVVFQKMTPNETKFIESSSKVESLMVNNNSFIQFIVRDFPGSFEFTLMSQNDRIYFQNCKILVFIIDAQDEPYQPSVRKCVHSIKEAYKINDKMSFKVFIHKTDGDMFMSEDLKLEAQRSIVELLRNELEDSNIPEPPVFMTSIYDHSIFVALSLVVQNLSPQVDYLQNMLDILLSNCRIDKIYLFDVISKLYIATDSTPVDMVSYELCSDMIDVIIDVSCIYGMGQTGQGFDGQSSSLIKLDNGLILYLREIHSLLALVCLIKDENFDRSFQGGSQKPIPNLVNDQLILTISAHYKFYPYQSSPTSLLNLKPIYQVIQLQIQIYLGQDTVQVKNIISCYANQINGFKYLSQ